MKKVVLVADIPNWAFDFIAKTIRDNLSTEYDFEVVYSDTYEDKVKFARDIFLKDDVVCVHFFWRRFLNNLLIQVKKSKDRKLIHAISTTGLSFSVPDNLLTSVSDLATLSPAFYAADGYLAVSEHLRIKYSALDSIPSPTAVVHDLIPELFSRKEISKDYSNPLKVVWVGNSKWGEIWGFEDFKGFHNIVSPAIDAVMSSIDFEFLALDSSSEKIDRSKIIETLETAHILLCASENEGTPLPLLEAMACGCAVITTDVGIAQEVLPTVQHRYIVDRSKQSFVDALTELLNDKNLVGKLSEENLEAIANITKETKSAEWSAYLDKVIEAAKASDRIENKKKIMGVASDTLSYTVLYDLKKNLKKIPIAERVLMPAYRKLATARRNTSAPKLSVVDQELFHKYINKLSNKDNVAIYVPAFHGVKHSTLELFDDVFPIPLLEQYNPMTLSDEGLLVYADALREINAPRFIFSGGFEKHLIIANRLRELGYTGEIDLLWHGSQSQWFTVSHYTLLNSWIEACQSNNVNRIGFFKNGLDKIIETQGVDTFMLRNYIRSTRLECEHATNTFDIKNPHFGLWAAVHSWIKNIYSQLLALSMIENPFLYHNLNREMDDDILNLFKIQNEKIGVNIPRKELIASMQQVDITMYITFSECSPMTPLESLSQMTPCLVGNSTDIFDEHHVLENYLVVERPDDAMAIQRKVKTVMENYDFVRSLIPGFWSEYNAKSEFLLNKYLGDS